MINEIQDPNVIHTLAGKPMPVHLLNGMGASTDNVKLYLPAEIQDKDGNENAIRGVLDHETDHVRHSNFDLLSGLKPRLKGCLNLLEDLRLDTTRVEKGLGYTINARAFYKWVGKVTKKHIKKNPRADKIASWNLLAECLNIPNPFEGLNTNESVRLTDLARPLVEKAIQCASTNDLLPLAEELDSLWYEKEPEQEQSSGDQQKESEHADDSESGLDPQDDNSESGESDESKDNEGNGKSNENNSKEEFEKSLGNPEYEESEESEESKGGNSASEESEKGKDEVENQTQKVPQEAELNRVSETDGSLSELFDIKFKELLKAHSNSIYIVDTSVDGEYTCTNNDADAKGYARDMKKLNQMVHPLVFKFTNALVSESRSRFISKQYKGKLDSRRIANMQRDPKVFMQRTAKQRLNTAVTYLIDLSGSMRGMNIELARLSAMLLAEVSDKVGIPFEILGFTTNEYTPQNYTNVRSYGVQHVIFKNYATSYITSKLRLSSIKTNINNFGPYNVDGEALMWSAQRIWNRKEKRRIIVVLSDGMPNVPSSKSNRGLLDTHLNGVIKMVRSAGIEVYSIGLGYNPVKFYGKEYSRVLGGNDDFTTEFFESFIEIINKGIK